MSIYDKAIIGAGAGAMYYLDARMGSDLTNEIKEKFKAQFEKITNREDRKKALKHLMFEGVDLTSNRHLFKNTVLIGEPGPWNIQKNYQYIGRGGEYFVNHSRQVISTRPLSSYDNKMERAAVREGWQKVFNDKDSEVDHELFNQSQGYTTREDFRDEWLEVHSRAMTLGLTHCSGQVTQITFVDASTDEEKHFVITYKGIESGTVKARELLLVTGGGDYLKPTLRNGINAPNWESNKRIMDLDQFMRYLSATGETGKRVCIQGANAAIDGVEQAIRYRFQVHWLVRSGVNILSNSLLKHSPKLADSKTGTYSPGNGAKDATIQKGVSYTEIEGNGGAPLTVKVYKEDEAKTRTLLSTYTNVDYYVYCIGQEVTATLSGVAKLLIDNKLVKEDGGKINDPELEPIFDEGWFFQKHTSRTATLQEAAIGIRKKFKGPCRIDILGAASFMLVPPTSPIGLKLKPITNYQIRSVADVRQLGAIRDVMRAYCNTLSGSSLDPKNVNFLGGTKNEIAAFIAMHYEFIPPVVADELTNFLMLVRTRDEYTNGYTGSEISRIRDALKEIDNYFKQEREIREFLEKKMTQVVLKYRTRMLEAFKDVLPGVRWVDITRED